MKLTENTHYLPHFLSEIGSPMIYQLIYLSELPHHVNALSKTNVCKGNMSLFLFKPGKQLAEHMFELSCRPSSGYPVQSSRNRRTRKLTECSSGKEQVDLICFSKCHPMARTKRAARNHPEQPSGAK